MGSPDIRQIDGIGGGDALTSQALIVNHSSSPGIDVEYLFAQIAVGMGAVDTTPNCGNMLAAVAAFAIERGLVDATDPQTTVRIFNVNTGKVVHALVPTPASKVTYEGDARIDGVPGTGAAIVLDFLDATGARTGRLLPTGNAVDSIDGLRVSCVDFAIPVVILAASSVGKTGYETKQELDADKDLLKRLEQVRRAAGRLMGLGDVARGVLPKIALVAPPRDDGSITSRFFVPWNCHAAHSVTGALCVAAACCIPGSVAADVARVEGGTAQTVGIEHPSGRLDTRLEMQATTAAGLPRITRAGVVRTARPLFDGIAYVHGPAAGS
jgi:2-methylaconitate cis-trans-isomerase PrpF